MDTIALHNELTAQFKKEFFRELLTPEHQVSGEIFINKLNYPDRRVNDEANFWGYKFQKNGARYLLPSRRDEKEPINIKKVLPVWSTNAVKVANKQESFWLIRHVEPAGFKEKQHLTFRELCDTLNCIPHTNPKHKLLRTILAFTQITERMNERTCSPAGFGKDTTLDAFRDLYGSASTIVSPTLAKLKYLVNMSWLAINEVVDVSADKWRQIQLFLLDAGAFKTETPNNSRSSSGVGETFDLMNLSLSLFYNDIDHYSKPEKYLDNIAQGALLERFPPFRFWGTYDYDFNKINDIDQETYVKENFQEYKKIPETIEYFKTNKLSGVHGYTTTLFDDMPRRWKTNLYKILKNIDRYAESQEEFNDLCETLLRAMGDYKDMISYVGYVKGLAKKVGVGEDDLKHIYFIDAPNPEITTSHKHFLTTWLKEQPESDRIKGLLHFCKEVMKKPTFTERNRMIRNWREKVCIEDTSFWK